MMFRPTTLASAACALALSTTLAVAGPGAAGHSHKTFGAAGEPGGSKEARRTDRRGEDARDA